MKILSNAPLEKLERLENENFVKRAPGEVVEAEKKKLSEIKAQIELIDKNLALFGSSQ
jgi:valyl-tRNA synthetase